MSNTSSGFALRHLPATARLGITCLLLVLLAGLAASGLHLFWHHQNRDEQPGLSMTDIEGAYHGVTSRARLLTALERTPPHPAPTDLPEVQRAALVKWLTSNRISEDYDSLTLGDAAPSEIIAASCLKCHARNATQGEGIGQKIPLEFWDDVKKLAFSRDIRPTDLKILAASTHTHALSLGVLVLIAGLLAMVTRWPGWLTGGLFMLGGASLLLDIVAQWVARDSASAVMVIVVGGTVFAVATALLLLLTIIDLWCPPRRS